MRKNKLQNSRFRQGTGFFTEFGKIYKCLGLLLFCLVCLLLWHPMQADAKGLKDKEGPYVIVIDPGHGGKNDGTSEGEILEKEMDLQTALSMANTLSYYDNIQVYLTRTGDENVDLDKRALFAAEKQADLLISLHYNASLTHRLYGAECWVQMTNPYHAYGHALGRIWISNMQKEGLLIRGIKTRESENTPGNEYYGILRHSLEQEIPAVILEHAHVDHDNDLPFLDSEEKRIRFGELDALSLAEFLGLPLKEKWVGNCEYPSFAAAPSPVQQVNESFLNFQSFNDFTPPDVCLIEQVGELSPDGMLTVSVSGADYNSTLLYYDYSIDGGQSYSELIEWPQSDALSEHYQDTFYLNLPIPENTFVKVRVRAYNLFDQYTESNELSGIPVYHAPGKDEEKPVLSDQIETPLPKETPVAVPLNVPEEKTDFWAFELFGMDTVRDLAGFLGFCFLATVILVAMILSVVLVNRKGKRKKR